MLSVWYCDGSVVSVISILTLVPSECTGLIISKSTISPLSDMYHSDWVSNLIPNVLLIPSTVPLIQHLLTLELVNLSSSKFSSPIILWVCFLPLDGIISPNSKEILSPLIFLPLIRIVCPCFRVSRLPLFNWLSMLFMF